MFLALGILVIIVSVLLTLIVLIQNPKGGVLSSTFGSMGNQILGANRSTDVVEKITWGLAGILGVLCVASIFILPSGNVQTTTSPSQQKSEIEEAIKSGKSASTLPTAPLPNSAAPATQPATSPAPAGNTQSQPTQQPAAPKK